MHINRKYDLLLFSTFMNVEKIEILLDSLIVNKTLKICLIVLAQNGLKLDISKYTSSFNSIIFILSEKQHGLSDARNRCISYTLEHNISARFVMFPDDDAAFSPDFFKVFNNFVEEDKGYIITSYCDNTTKHLLKSKCIEGQLLNYKNTHDVCSINMLIPFAVFNTVRYFDDLIGVGAKYGSCEDIDYYLRCLKHLDNFTYTFKLFNYHPMFIDKLNSLPIKQLVKRFIGYGNGAIYLYVKHKIYSKAFILCLRAIVGSIVKFFQLQFKLSTAYFVCFFTRTYTLFNLLFEPKNKKKFNNKLA